MKVFQPRYSKSQEKATWVTARTDKTSLLGGIVSSGSTPHRLIQEKVEEGSKKANVDIRSNPEDITSTISNNFEHNNSPSPPKQTKPLDDAPHADELMLLEALVWSGLYEGENVERLKDYLRRWFECADKGALEPLLTYLENPEVQAVLRAEAQQRI
jgi:hypothetical protein